MSAARLPLQTAAGFCCSDASGVGRSSGQANRVHRSAELARVLQHHAWVAVARRTGCTGAYHPPSPTTLRPDLIRLTTESQGSQSQPRGRRQ